eukprot:TRINITY_DN12202_c0_g1_i2.p1 TRINITY_DN12202_c0_g1~~TRINITY_DN12202_c0_g1_i2.p1  ORF type:complete len:368 (+),score=73.42 TRINITY_DN12202_c0_g1_i2:153-1256(+)
MCIRDSINAEYGELPHHGHMGALDQLLHTEPLGSRLPEVQAAWDALTAGFEQMAHNGGLTPEVIQMLRGMPLDQTPESFRDRCHVTKFEVEVADGRGQMAVWVVRPNNLNPTPQPAQLWFHGGGFVCGSAASFLNACCQRAFNNSTVLVAPDVGVAPEITAEHWLKNAVLTHDWVIQHSSEIGVDTSKLATSGESAGGFTSLGLCMRLAEQGRADELRLFVSDIGAFDSDFLDAATPEDEADPMHRACSLLQRQALGLLLGTSDPAELESHKTDPSLFPAQMPPELLDLLPPTVLMTSEFDHVGKRCNERFAARLAPHGKLAGLYVQPGVGHGMYTCLLYTSDAADEEDSVDLGGRRIIKKKKRRKY